jgi:hypothetical protein
MNVGKTLAATLPTSLWSRETASIEEAMMHDAQLPPDFPRVRALCSVVCAR